MYFFRLGTPTMNSLICGFRKGVLIKHGHNHHTYTNTYSRECIELNYNIYIQQLIVNILVNTIMIINNKIHINNNISYTKCTYYKPIRFMRNILTQCKLNRRMLSPA